MYIYIYIYIYKTYIAVLKKLKSIFLQWYILIFRIVFQYHLHLNLKKKLWSESLSKKLERRIILKIK